MYEVINAIRDALNKECWLPALALSLTIPDVMGQVAYPELVNSKGKRLVGRQYKRWFHEYVEHRFADHTGFDANSKAKNPYFSAEMCYALRNEILHANNDDIEFTYEFEHEEKTEDQKEKFDYDYTFELHVNSCDNYGAFWVDQGKGKRVVKHVTVCVDVKTLCTALYEEAEKFLQNVDKELLHNHTICIVDVEQALKKIHLS